MSSAVRQTERLLWLIPAAARKGGVSLREAADHLGVEPSQVLADLEVLTQREFYAPSGSTEGLQIWRGEGDRWHMSGPGAETLRRPVRLTAREALCLALAIRGRATRDRNDLLEHLETRLRGLHLAETDPEQELSDAAVALPDFEPDAQGIRLRLTRAVRERRRCEFDYLKRSSPRAEPRQLEPWVLCVAEGVWYAVGRDPLADGPRAFRLDRMLDVRLTDQHFEPPRDFDAGSLIEAGRIRVIDPESPTAEALEAVVCYIAEVARLVLEQWPGTLRDDGSVHVRHQVHDPDWLVRHVLGFGTAAEVLSPPELRQQVAQQVVRLTEHVAR